MRYSPDVNEARPRVLPVLLRALRERCPRCGEGSVFARPRGLEGAERCVPCGWCFVRCDGHWIGGAEINLFATFMAGVVVLGAGVFLLGNDLWVHGVGALFVVAFAVATRRRSRALFYACDYLIDPDPDGVPPTGSGRDFQDEAPDEPGPRSGGPGRRAEAEPVRPVTFVPPTRPRTTTPARDRDA